MTELHRRWDAANKSRRRIYEVERRIAYQKNPLRQLLLDAKRRAAKRNVEFNLALEHLKLPKKCPVLGIPISVGKGVPHNGSPALDRVDNSRGYVPGNVCVISYRANRLKSDATIHELKAIVSYMESFR